MPTNVQDSAMMVCYRECLSNLEKYGGGEEQKVVQFINNIERIGKMINANDDVLHCMCTAKLDGEAKRWYEDNMSLTQWEHLKSALVERFTTSDSSSRIFEQLKERKQKSEETITSYYDAIIKLCREYDSSMSQKMMISWLQNGIRESLKIPIKRQMKLLSEPARTTQAFLKIAKDEQELQEENLPESEPTSSYAPYFANAVSAMLQQTKNEPPNTVDHRYHASTTTPYRSNTPYQQQRTINSSQQRPSQIHQSTSQQRSIASQPKPSAFQRNKQQMHVENDISFNTSNLNARKVNPCLICHQNNHRTIDCYYKKPSGCFKCGQYDHRVRDCPQVFD
jgi:hypothetical protein